MQFTRGSYEQRASFVSTSASNCAKIVSPFYFSSQSKGDTRYNFDSIIIDIHICICSICMYIQQNKIIFHNQCVDFYNLVLFKFAISFYNMLTNFNVTDVIDVMIDYCVPECKKLVAWKRKYLRIFLYPIWPLVIRITILVFKQSCVSTYLHKRSKCVILYLNAHV